VLEGGRSIRLSYGRLNIQNMGFRFVRAEAFEYDDTCKDTQRKKLIQQVQTPDWRNRLTNSLLFLPGMNSGGKLNGKRVSASGLIQTP